ncbi:MAG: porin family protein [Gammaproteobacteria bacterium]
MKKLIFALIAAATAMSAAHAQGPYVGLGVASTDHEYNFSGADGDGWKANAKIFGGYEFDQTWGIEAGYTDIRKADARYTVGNTNGTLHTDGNRSYIAAKANLPINEQVSVYGKLGVGYSKVKASTSVPNLSWSDSKTEAYGGLGAQYALNKNVALTLEYERYGKKKDVGAKADQITVGARYAF